MSLSRSRCDSFFDCLEGEDEKGCDSRQVDPLPGQRSAGEGKLEDTDSLNETTTPVTSYTEQTTDDENISSTTYFTTEDGTVQTTDEETSTTLQTTTEEQILQSQQTDSVDISNLYTCKR